MEIEKYLEVFIDESNDHLQSINDHLLELEKNPQNLTIVEEIFRSAHTLKGMSASMGYQDLANLTHQLENVLDAMKNRKIQINAAMLDVVFESVDYLEAIVADIASDGVSERDVTEVVQLLQAVEKGEPLSSVRKNTGETEWDVQKKDQDEALQVDEFTCTILEQATEQGHNSYQVIVSLREDCLFKAARVYMVFESLEQIGEIIASNPAVEALGNQNFDTRFTLLFITKESRRKVEEQIVKVSEIDYVQVQDFSSGERDSLEISNDRLAEAEATIENETQPLSEVNREKPTSVDTKAKQVASKTIRVNIRRLDRLMNLFDELVIDRRRLERISNELQHPELQETVNHMTQVSGDLQEVILKMRMVPIQQVFNRFPRVVRQLSRHLNKQVDIKVIGGDITLDRSVIEEIGDPLVHLVRNAVDHGIESPSERESKGKSATGTLDLKAYRSGNHVFIEVSDDGGGISRDRVINKAIKNGVMTGEQALNMTNTQVYELILESGFSTADAISDVSGRGVGLDVVKRTIKLLGGDISIDSQLDRGSTFSIRLPLT